MPVLMLLLFLPLLLLLGALVTCGAPGNERELKHPNLWEQAA